MMIVLDETVAKRMLMNYESAQAGIAGLTGKRAAYNKWYPTESGRWESTGRSVFGGLYLATEQLLEYLQDWFPDGPPEGSTDQIQGRPPSEVLQVSAVGYPREKS